MEEKDEGVDKSGERIAYATLPIRGMLISGIALEARPYAITIRVGSHAASNRRGEARD